MIKLCKILSGPFTIVFAWWFMSVIVPSLSNETQSAINDGNFGAVIGFIGGGVVLICCMESWKQMGTLFKTKSVE